MQKTQQRITQYLKERHWHQNEPVDLAKSITIEGAELLELFQWESPKRKKILTDKKLVQSISKELADVFIYAYGMAVTLGLDAETIVLSKLQEVEKKYPPEKILHNRSNYLKIKKAHRKKHA